MCVCEGFERFFTQWSVVQAALKLVAEPQHRKVIRVPPEPWHEARRAQVMRVQTRLPVCVGVTHAQTLVLLNCGRTLS